MDTCSLMVVYVLLGLALLVSLLLLGISVLGYVSHIRSKRYRNPGLWYWK